MFLTVSGLLWDKVAELNADTDASDTEVGTNTLAATIFALGGVYGIAVSLGIAPPLSHLRRNRG